MADFFAKNLFLVVLFTTLALWLALQFNAALNFDHAWLVTTAQRFLAGGAMAHDFYETNPPLSVLLYVPIVLLGKIIPLQYAPYAFCFICLCLSALAVHKILQRWSFIGGQQRTAIVGAYAITNTLATSAAYFYFGEREQFLIMGLYPFLLVQLSATWRIDLPFRLKWSVLIAGAVAVLIKPQFGIFPVIALAHRMIAQKSLVILDRDFISLALAVLAYATVIALFFRDYVEIIFPDFLRFYLPVENPDTPAIGAIYIALFTCGTLLTAMSGLPWQKLKLPMLSFAAAFLSLALFCMQQKGMYYHLFPAFTFFYTGLALALAEAIEQYGMRKVGANIAIIIVATLTALLGNPLGTNRLQHSDYPRTSLAKAIDDCPAPCTFYMFGHSGEIIHQLALYGHATHGSRFGALWWLPGLLEMPEDDPERAKLTGKYLGFVREDMQLYRPARLIIINNATIAGHKNFDLLEFFRRDKALAAELAHYKISGQVITYWKEYQPAAGTENMKLIYDIYERND